MGKRMNVVGINVYENLTPRAKIEVDCGRCNCHIKKSPESTSNDLLWQQMNIKYFYTLLATNCLCFKPLAGYSDRDERKLGFYGNLYAEAAGAKRESAQENIRSIVSDFERRLYVSCWYHADQLTDIVFKEYSKAPAGVAVGVAKSSLISALQEHACETPGNFLDSCILGSGSASFVGRDGCLYHGDVVYLPEYLTKPVSPCDLLTPAFIKSQNHNEDREYRLCFVDEGAGACDAAKQSFRYLPVGNAFDLIKKVAVKSDDIGMLYLVRRICEAVHPGSVNQITFQKSLGRALGDSSSCPSCDADGFVTLDIV